ncbi:hypothetical protein niasHT_025720 [Heterodera trifolii]|uniref:Uncharacterized protein n=1 Tax=Heterodera trifolii TaxID=157864 RepID=A0ABD2K8D9_9BILA
MVWSVAALDLDLLTYWMLIGLAYAGAALSAQRGARPVSACPTCAVARPASAGARLLCAIVRAPLRSLLWRPVAAQLLVSALSTRVYVHNRAGALYLCRIFDFLGTFLIIRFGANFLNNTNIAGGNKEETQRRRGRVAIWVLLVTANPHKGPLAFSASLSWLEFGNIEWDPWALFLAPLLALAQAVHILLLKQAQLAFFAALGMPNGNNGCECCEHGTHPHHRPRVALPDETFEWFALCYLVAVGTLLAPTALHSYANSVVPYDASWESIDYLLMGMSVVFMSGFKYSELWLISRLEPHQFCALEHSKYFMASIGQWFLQNMAHATVFAAVGKALFVVSALRYWLRADEMDAVGGARAKEKCGPKSSFAG